MDPPEKDTMESETATRALSVNTLLEKDPRRGHIRSFIERRHLVDRPCAM